MRSPIFSRAPLGVAALVAATVSLAARTPSPALLVLNKSIARLEIVDLAIGKVVGRVPTGDGPHEIVVSGDGKLAFVSNYGGAQSPGSTISVIDLAIDRELRRVDVSPFLRPHGLAFSGGKLYFTSEARRLVGRYDVATGKIDETIETGQTTTHMVVASKDGRLIFTANIGSNTVTALARGGRSGSWKVTSIAVGDGPEGLDLSPDGRELWTAHSRDGGVSIVDVAANKVIGTIALHTRCSNRLKFTEDGRRVLVSDLDGGELVVVDALTRREIKRLALGSQPEGILIEPGGTRAYVAVAGDDVVAIVDLRTLEVTGRIQTGAGPDGMAWAP